MMPDPYILHKLALAPFLGGEHKKVSTNISALPENDRERFVDFLLSNGLASFWSKLLHNNEISSLFSTEEIQQIKRASLANGANYLMQKYVLDLITSLFSKESISHAVYKGGHVREIIYDPPSLRSAADIDILIHPTDLTRTIRALTEAGFSLTVNKENISHEVTLFYKNVAIDLHWHVLRPGRLRISPVEEFLATRQQFDTHTGFNAETTLFIMLVHPVFTKYSTTSLASLVRMIDLIQWIHTQSINWDILLELLQKYRVCTAAWITAAYLELLTGESLPDEFLKQIRPQKIKRSYLNNWLQANSASNLLGHPLLIQLGFTLPAHDSVLDAARFIRMLLQEKYLAKQKVEDLLAENC
jgi:hypothetical protein